MSITIIAAVTRDLALGRKDQLLYHISDDMRRFRALTTGHAIVMGRRTFESFPKGALPNRRNIVVTRQTDYSAPGIEVYNSLDSALDACKGEADQEVFILGGGEIYRQAFPLADRLELTEIDAYAPDADTFFPAVDPTLWQLTDVSPTAIDPLTSVSYRFATYTRIS